MAIVKHYDPALYPLTWRGILFRGFSDGTMIAVERSEDAYSMAVGGTGDVTFVRNRNRTGSVTVMLQAASPTNDELSTVALLDEATGLGFGPLLLKNLNGTTIVESDSARIRKLPKVEVGVDAGSTEWIIDCPELEMFVGGAVI